MKREYTIDPKTGVHELVGHIVMLPLDPGELAVQDGVVIANVGRMLYVVGYATRIHGKLFKLLDSAVPLTIRDVTAGTRAHVQWQFELARQRFVERMGVNDIIATWWTVLPALDAQAELLEWDGSPRQLFEASQQRTS